METEIKPWGKFNQYLPGIFLAKREKEAVEKNRKKITSSGFFQVDNNTYKKCNVNCN